MTKKVKTLKDSKTSCLEKLTACLVSFPFTLSVGYEFRIEIIVFYVYGFSSDRFEVSKTLSSNMGRCPGEWGWVWTL